MSFGKKWTDVNKDNILSGRTRSQSLSENTKEKLQKVAEKLEVISSIESEAQKFENLLEKDLSRKKNPEVTSDEEEEDSEPNPLNQQITETSIQSEAETNKVDNQEKEDQ